MSSQSLARLVQFLTEARSLMAHDGYPKHNRREERDAQCGANRGSKLDDHESLQRIEFAFPDPMQAHHG